MPICKYCHSRISKFDKDICPICGAKDPLSGVTSDTIEVTHVIDSLDPVFKKEAPRKKTLALLYFTLLGVFGVGFGYLRYKVFAVIWCVINLALIGGVGAALLFTPVKFFGFIIMTGAMYVVNGIIGLCYRFIPNAKDHSGELIL